VKCKGWEPNLQSPDDKRDILTSTLQHGVVLQKQAIFSRVLQ